MSSSPRKMPPRAVVYPRDIVNIMGVKLRTAYRIRAKILAANGKDSDGCLTVLEFCAFTKIPEETVLKYLLD